MKSIYMMILILAAVSSTTILSAQSIMTEKEKE